MPTFWNLKNSNPSGDWEAMGHKAATPYSRLLIRENSRNVVEEESPLLASLGFLMGKFGSSFQFVKKAYALHSDILFTSFENRWRLMYNEHRASAKMLKKTEWKQKQDALQKFRFWDHFNLTAAFYDWNSNNTVPTLFFFLIFLFSDYFSIP